MLRIYEHCRREVATVQRVAGPAGTLLGLSAAALLLSGLVVSLSG